MTQVTSLENRIKFLQKMLVKSTFQNSNSDAEAVAEIMDALNSARNKRKDIKKQRKSLLNNY